MHTNTQKYLIPCDKTNTMTHLCTEVLHNIPTPIIQLVTDFNANVN